MKRTTTRTTTKKPRQTTIPGTADVVPAEVQEAADEYVGHKRAVAASREKMNNSLTELIELMKANDVAEIFIDDQEKKLILTVKDLIKIKARKKSKKDSDNSADDLV